MSVVRRRPTKLIIGNWTSASDILQKPAPAIVAKHDVELLVGTKTENSSVVIAARGLTRVLLQRSAA
jgi:hypothetical protein